MTITSADMQDLKCCKSYLSPPPAARQQTQAEDSSRPEHL